MLLTKGFSYTQTNFPSLVIKVRNSSEIHSGFKKNQCFRILIKIENFPLFDLMYTLDYYHCLFLFLQVAIQVGK